MKSFQLTIVLLFLWAVLTAHVCGSGSGSGTTEPNSIFLLAGQSNMSGRGGLGSDPKNKSRIILDPVCVPDQCHPNSSILRLSKKLKWVVAQEPLHFDIDSTKTCGVGPGMPFATELLMKKDVAASVGVIGLVPCAIGGTYISEWGRGEKLYKQLMRRAGAAVQASNGGKIRALLWYQGESDADSESYSSYAREVEKFFQSVRKDLGLPELPIIQVALPLAAKGNHTAEIRESQLGLKLPGLTTVDANGSELRYDHLHLTAQAQVHLGTIMAHAFLQTI